VGRDIGYIQRAIGTTSPSGEASGAGRGELQKSELKVALNGRSTQHPRRTARGSTG